MPSPLEETHPHLLDEWDWDTNNAIDIYPSQRSRGSQAYAHWICNQCAYSWRCQIASRANLGTGCPACSGRVPRTPADSFEYMFPELMKEWDYKNNTFEPSSVLPKSSKKAFWYCSTCNHSWNTTIDSRTYKKTGCPACAGKAVTDTNNLKVKEPELASQWHPIKNKCKPEEVYFRTSLRVWWQCHQGHEWQTSVEQRVLAKSGCAQCSGRKASKENNFSQLSVAKEWHPIKNKTLPQDYAKGSGFNAWWKCLTCSHEWQARIVTRTKGHGCPACTSQVVTQQNCLATHYPELVLDWHPDNDKGADEYTRYSGQRVQWKCHKCEHEWAAVIANRSFSGHGCPSCAGKVASTTHSVAYSAPHLIDEWHAKNSKNPTEMTPGSSQKVWWQCRTCNHEWQSVIANRVILGRGCPACANQVVTATNCLATQYPVVAQSWDNERNKDTPADVVPGSNQLRWWKCVTCEYSWKSTISGRSQGRGCPACAGQAVTARNSLATQFPEVAQEWVKCLTQPLFEPVHVVYGSGHRVTWRCSNCTYEWDARVVERVLGTSNCPSCYKNVPSKNYSLSALFPDLVTEWHTEKNQQRPHEYLPFSQHRVWWKCRDCDYEWESMISNRSNLGRNCPSCNRGWTLLNFQRWLKNHIVQLSEYSQGTSIITNVSLHRAYGPARSIVEAYLSQDLPYEELVAYINGGSETIDAIIEAHDPFEYGNRKAIPDDTRARILARDGACVNPYCHTDPTDLIRSRLCIDHIVPLSRGGSDTEDNYQILCLSCNSRKSATDWETFLAKEAALQLTAS